MEGHAMPDIKTRHLMTMRIAAPEPPLRPLTYGKTPYGERWVMPVPGGWFRGDRLSGRIAFGSDWLIRRPDQATELNVRITLETDDGHLIGMQYRGLRVGSPEVEARHVRGETIDASEYYFRIAPFFETASEKYDWMNRLIAVGVGDRTADGPGYEIYEIL
jgi:hypothetical protein